MIDSYSLVFRWIEDPNRASLRHESPGGVLCIDADFDRMPIDRKHVLVLRKGLAIGDLQLPIDQVDVGDQLRDRVLDLKPRVHFQK